MSSSVCLADVETAMEQPGPRFFVGLRVHVVNFEPNGIPWPRTFMYKGCLVPSGSGKVCSKALQNSVCEYHPKSQLKGDLLRFKVYLCDGSMGGRPLLATVFNMAGHNLLLTTAATLDGMGEFEQFSYVSSIIRGFPLCEVALKTKNGENVIQVLSRVPYPSLSSLNMASPCKGKICNPGGLEHGDTAGARVKREAVEEEDVIFTATRIRSCGRHVGQASGSSMESRNVAFVGETPMSSKGSGIYGGDVGNSSLSAKQLRRMEEEELVAKEIDDAFERLKLRIMTFGRASNDDSDQL